MKRVHSHVFVVADEAGEIYIFANYEEAQEVQDALNQHRGGVWLLNEEPIMGAKAAKEIVEDLRREQ